MTEGTRFTSGGKERRAIRAALHDERAVVQVGKAGLEPAVIVSVEQALGAREAIKVAIGRSCPLEPAEVATALAREVGAEVIERKGRVISLYRPAEGPSEEC
ncbi:MAG TPA: YhbY family RNA-binding protein [Acidobacteria bacterium]|nr:YhbY family RNA-binding protein [Acidobacteriota bacterium]